MPTSTFLCLYADVYGFKSLVYENVDSTSARLRNYQDKLLRLINQYRGTHPIRSISTFMFSDNLLLLQEFDPTETRNAARIFAGFVGIVGDAYLESLRLDLPMRGCITFGDVTVTQQAVAGVPIIHAVEYEQQIALPLIFLPMATAHDICRDTKLSQQELLSMLGSPIDLPYNDGITSCYPIRTSNPEVVQAYARQRYEILRSGRHLERPTSAWKQVATTLERDAHDRLQDCR